MSDLVSYSKENLGKLNILQAVKMRPGMYIGSTDTNGFINLVESLFFDLKPLNASPIQVKLKLCKNDNFKISLKGANLDPLTEFLLPPPSEPQAWTNKFTFDLRYFMAFTDHSTIKVKREKETHYINSKGIDFKIRNSKEKNDKEQLSIQFKLDKIIFKDLALNKQLIRETFTQFAFLTPNLKISLINNRQGNKTREVYYFPKGISEKLQLEIEKQTTTKPLFVFDKKAQINNYNYHIACCFLDNWTAKKYIKTYADRTHLYMGGSLEDGIIKGIEKAINESINNEVPIGSHKIKERLILLAQVTGDHFSFKHAIKAALDMPELEKEISNYMKTTLLSVLKESINWEKELS